MLQTRSGFDTAFSLSDENTTYLLSSDGDVGTHCLFEWRDSVLNMIYKGVCGPASSEPLPTTTNASIIWGDQDGNDEMVAILAPPTATNGAFVKCFTDKIIPENQNLFFKFCSGPDPQKPESSFDPFLWLKLGLSATGVALSVVGLLLALKYRSKCKSRQREGYNTLPDQSPGRPSESATPETSEHNSKREDLPGPLGSTSNAADGARSEISEPKDIPRPRHFKR